MNFSLFQNNATQDIAWDINLALAITTEYKPQMYKENPSSFLREFFIVLAICNTVVVSGQQPSSPANKVTFEETEDSTNTTPKPCRRQAGHDIPCNTNTLGVNGCDGESIQNNGRINQGLVPSPGKKSPQKHNGLFVPTRLNIDQQSPSYNDIVYEAESPDEAALVKMASSYGFKLISRSPHTVTLLIPEEGLVTYEVLHILPFDSSRKRMSVIVRRPPDGEIMMYCKGADSVVMERLSRDHRKDEGDQTDAHGGGSRRVSMIESTEIHLDVYARDGLRTLCMARKVRNSCLSSFSRGRREGLGEGDPPSAF